MIVVVIAEELWAADVFAKVGAFWEPLWEAGEPVDTDVWGEGHA